MLKKIEKMLVREARIQEAKEVRTLARQLQATRGPLASSRGHAGGRKKTRKPVAADDFLAFLQTQASMRSQARHCPTRDCPPASY